MQQLVLLRVYFCVVSIVGDFVVSAEISVDFAELVRDPCALKKAAAQAHLEGFILNFVPLS